MDDLSFTATPDALITQGETEAIAGIKKSGIWRGVNDGTFPQPVRISTRCTRWSRNEVLAWVEARKRERAAPKISPKKIARKTESSDAHACA